MNSRETNRRRFLKKSVALAGLAVGGMRSASGQTPGSATPDGSARDPRLYGERSSFEKSAREIERDGRTRPFSSAALLTPLQDLDGIITPSALHYVNDHGPSKDELDPRNHRLMIHGMVERPIVFTLEELKRLPAVSRIYFIECPGNTTPNSNGRSRETVQQSHGRTSCSEWTGVPLSLLLKGTGVKSGASWVVAESADPQKYAKSIPLDKCMEDTLVAYSQNGEAVRPENGYPVRLVVPGWEGISSVKWLRRIKVVDQPYLFQNEIGAQPHVRHDGKARWFQFVMGPNSVITRPSGKQQIPGPGFYVITGLAWSGNGTVRRVEVSTDGGRTWKDARLEDPVLPLAHARFNLDWQWNGQEAVLQSRCTDDKGFVQPSLEELGKIWGVQKSFWTTATTNMGHFNPIYPWKVNRDGSVHNALFA